MDEPYQIRPATRADVPLLAELERLSFSDPWTPAQLRQSLGETGAVALVAVGHDRAIGYVLGRVVVDQAEILSLATEPASRRAGVGRRLLVQLIERMRMAGAATVWLEVRASNDAAQRLYRAAGFQVATRRRDYYRTPLEDALVLRHDFPSSRDEVPACVDTVT